MAIKSKDLAIAVSFWNLLKRSVDLLRYSHAESEIRILISIITSRVGPDTGYPANYFFPITGYPAG